MRAESSLPADSSGEVDRQRADWQIRADSSLPGDEAQLGEGLSPSEKDGVRGRVSVRLARLLTSLETDYRYDPKHESRPAGPGWQETEKGWTTVKEEQPKQVQPQQAPGGKPEETQGQAPTKHLQEHELKHRVHLKRDELKRTLDSGYYSLISAGRNSRDAQEKGMKPDDQFFRERHLALRDDLEKAGLKYTEVVGHYDGEEPSFMVFHDGQDLTDQTVGRFMVHHRGPRDFSTTRTLDRLGEKYKQDSVLHSRAGRNLVVFTTGEYRGKKCGGKGWKEEPESDNYYTDIPIEGKDHSKVKLDIATCFSRGYIASLIREAVKQAFDKATYRHDPKHHHRPLGPGWRSAPQGWSKSPVGTPPGPKPEEGDKGPIGYG
jgi:hypothetical protein